MEIDFSPLEGFVDQLVYQLIVLIAILAIAYIAVYLLLRFIKLPKRIANFFATISLLAAFYYSFAYGWIPGI